MTANVLTRKDCEQQLPDGTDPMIIAMHVAATAEDRAASRRAAVRAAAISWLRHRTLPRASEVMAEYVVENFTLVPETCRGISPGMTVTLMEVDVERGLECCHVQHDVAQRDCVTGELSTHPVWVTPWELSRPGLSLYDGRDLLPALLAVEMGGTGGRMGFGPNGGDSTQRMSWARHLGKGRRQATDGEAWTRSIEAVLLTEGDSEVVPGNVSRLAALCSTIDIEWPLAYALRRAFGLRTSPTESAPWAECARQIASLCEANSDAGRLADRWQLPTLPWLYEAHISLLWRDYDEQVNLLTDDGAELLIEELVESFSGQEFTLTAGWLRQVWRIQDDTDTSLSITMRPRCYDITIRTRRAGHPAVLAAVKDAWCMRAPGDVAWSEAVASAHLSLLGQAYSYKDTLPRQRIQWDIESGNGNWRADVKVGIEYNGHELSPVRWVCQCGAHGEWVYARADRTGRPLLGAESSAQDEARLAGSGHDCGNPGLPDPDQ